VACNESIHVYQPSFPDQSLSKEPQLILRPPVSSPNLDYHIDQDHPHSITRLLVDYLGNDEILLVTCDDGDVIGYRVDEVKRYLDESELATIGEKDDHEVGEVRTYLHRNVGASAWGLAVHREARMIAISANTHVVTVLAFALARPGNDTPESIEFPDDISLTSDSKTSDFPSPRNRDHVFTLLANHNVPAISFNNTTVDPDGRWLFSNCINGENVLWDIHNPRNPARMFQMGWCASADDSGTAPEYPLGHCRCLSASNYPHSAWGAMFLDPQSAHEIDEPELEPTHRAPCFEDANGQKSKFRLNHSGLSGLSVVTHDTMVNEISQSSPMVLSDSDSDESDDANSMDDDSASTDNETHTATDEVGYESATNVTVGQPVSLGTTDTPPSYTGPPLPSMQTVSDPPPNLPAGLAIQLLPVGTTLLTLDEIAQILYVNNDGMDEDSEDEEYDEEEDVTSLVPTSSDMYLYQNHPSRPFSQRKINPYCEIITNYQDFEGETVRTISSPQLTLPQHLTLPQSPAPCLIITKDDIFLLQRPLHPSTSSASEPITTLRRALHPGAQNTLIPSYDRLCFSTQIPSLGLFIIASPVGRAAVFALTCSRASGAYGFELAYMLPFSSGREDEVVGLVDGRVRLMGIAVGPVQGEADAGMRERARVLMYYTDHSVLSFEIGRRRSWGERGVGELIV
jgi:hypothetical protein